MDLRESRDLAEHVSLKAMCLASIAGNGEIDVRKAQDRIADLVEGAFASRFPYIKGTDEPEDEGDEYAKYFKLLDQMEEEKKQRDLEKQQQQ